jgi:hypothetical protein
VLVVCFHLGIPGHDLPDWTRELLKLLAGVRGTATTPPPDAQAAPDPIFTDVNPVVIINVIIVSNGNIQYSGLIV